MPVVYIDVLFFTNMLFDIILLILTGRLCCISPGRFRILIGGLIGAILGVTVFFLQISRFWTIAIVAVSSTAMLSATFLPCTKREFLRLNCCFYLSSFLLCGALSAIFWFSGNPAIMSNGIYYFPLSLSKLTALALPVATFLCISWKKAKSRLNLHPRNCSVTLSHLGKTIRIQGIIDTGCTLTDPISALPAMIIDSATATKLFAVNTPYPQTISFCTIDSANNTIPAFIPEKCVIITESGFFCCKCIVAVSPVNLKGKAIINPEIILNWRKKYELPNTVGKNPPSVQI